MLPYKTGQASGIQTPYWSPLITEKTGAPGIPFFLERVMDVNRSLVRLIVSTGEEVKARNGIGQDFLNEPVRTLYLPRWFLFDITLLVKGEPETMTLCQTAIKASVDELHVARSVYVNGIKASHLNWESFRSISSELCLGEFWHRLTGHIRPGWGLRHLCGSGEDTLYLSEVESHCGMIRPGYEFPEGQDIRDFDRVEKILDREGIIDSRKRSVRDCSRLIKAMLDEGDLFLEDRKIEDTTLL